MWDPQTDVPAVHGGGKKMYPKPIRGCTEHPRSCGTSGSFQGESLGITQNSSPSLAAVKPRACSIQELSPCPAALTAFPFCQQRSERMWQSEENKLWISSIGERENGRGRRKTNHKDRKGHGYLLFFQNNRVYTELFSV